MNNKGLSKSMVMILIILGVGIVSLIFILSLSKNGNRANPMRGNYDDPVEETTKGQVTTKAGESGNNTDPTTGEIIVAKNFNAPLSDIIVGNNFDGNYAVSLYFSGARFDFTCTSYNEETSHCDNGSAIMNIGTTILPIFTYSDEYSNYLLRPEDFYIILNDTNVVLVENYVGVKAGTAKFYDRKGTLQHTVNDVLTGYRDDGLLSNELYPNIAKNEFNYYTCDNNQVKIKARNISNIDEVTYEEIVENATCY